MTEPFGISSDWSRTSSSGVTILGGIADSSFGRFGMRRKDRRFDLSSQTETLAGKPTWTLSSRAQGRAWITLTGTRSSSGIIKSRIEPAHATDITPHLLVATPQPFAEGFLWPTRPARQLVCFQLQDDLYSHLLLRSSLLTSTEQAAEVVEVTWDGGALRELRELVGKIQSLSLQPGSSNVMALARRVASKLRRRGIRNVEKWAKELSKEVSEADD